MSSIMITLALSVIKYNCIALFDSREPNYTLLGGRRQRHKGGLVSPLRVCLPTEVFPMDNKETQTQRYCWMWRPTLNSSGASAAVSDNCLCYISGVVTVRLYNWHHTQFTLMVPVLELVPFSGALCTAKYCVVCVPMTPSLSELLEGLLDAKRYRGWGLILNLLT